MIHFWNTPGKDATLKGKWSSIRNIIISIVSSSWYVPPSFSPSDSIGEAFRIRTPVRWLLSKFVKACQNDDTGWKGIATPSSHPFVFTYLERRSTFFPFYFLHYSSLFPASDLYEGENSKRSHRWNVVAICFPSGLWLTRLPLNAFCETTRNIWIITGKGNTTRAVLIFCHRIIY